MTLLRLGTRGSELALAQSSQVAASLEAVHPNLKVELVVIKTKGDRDQNSALHKFGGKGIFTKEIEDALLNGAIELAVHSLKDLPTELAPGLALAMPPRREDPRDLLVSKVPLCDLPQGALIGTGSARRREQLRFLRPDLKFTEIRGNVGTRVRKWREGVCDATVLASAGVKRLGFEAVNLKLEEAFFLSFDECLPAASQGLLGIEMRSGDEATAMFLEAIADVDAGLAFRAERAFLKELDGGCHLPAGALAIVKDTTLQVTAFWAKEGSGLRKVVMTGGLDKAEDLGRQAALALKAP